MSRTLTPSFAASLALALSLVGCATDGASDDIGDGKNDGRTDTTGFVLVSQWGGTCDEGGGICQGIDIFTVNGPEILCGDEISEFCHLPAEIVDWSATGLSAAQLTAAYKQFPSSVDPGFGRPFLLRGAFDHSTGIYKVSQMWMSGTGSPAVGEGDFSKILANPDGSLTSYTLNSNRKLEIDDVDFAKTELEVDAIEAAHAEINGAGLIVAGQTDRADAGLVCAATQIYALMTP